MVSIHGIILSTGIGNGSDTSYSTSGTNIVTTFIRLVHVCMITQSYGFIAMQKLTDPFFLYTVPIVSTSLLCPFVRFVGVHYFDCLLHFAVGPQPHLAVQHLDVTLPSMLTTH